MFVCVFICVFICLCVPCNISVSMFSVVADHSSDFLPNFHNLPPAPCASALMSTSEMWNNVQTVVKIEKLKLVSKVRKSGVDVRNTKFLRFLPKSAKVFDENPLSVKKKKSTSEEKKTRCFRKHIFLL